MQRGKDNIEGITRVAVIATLCFMAVWGGVSVLAEIRPFWIDESRVIYNLKFKSPAALWGPLDFMQQFPRVYLCIVKLFTSAFDYSYFSLRFPAYLAGLMAIILAYRVANRLFPGSVHRLLFVIVLISSYTFTEYFVQIKQYTMEMLMSVVAVWQLLELLDSRQDGRMRVTRYLFLCFTFLACPFFSYTYPVVVAPLYGVALFLTIKEDQQNSSRSLLQLWLPLLLCAVSIAVFYVVDVSQLLADQGMRAWWGHLMAEKGFRVSFFFYSLFNMFAMVGSGLFFWILFGILGSVAFLKHLVGAVPMLKHPFDRRNAIRLYPTLLLLLVIVLNLAGKLPVGEPRLNAFTIPSICILIISLFEWMGTKKMALSITSRVLSLLLFAGVTGNIYTSFTSAISGPVYEKRLAIYKATELGVEQAQAQKLPIFITSGVAFPYDTTRNLPFANRVPGDWVIKTFPAYKVSVGTAVCAIKDTAAIAQCEAQQPQTIKAAMVGNGLYYRVVSW